MKRKIFLVEKLNSQEVNLSNTEDNTLSKAAKFARVHQSYI